ncbi:RIP metalloprotease RseP [bacterium]|nr:RIP metalloprotease RseP [bacterium]
MITTIVSFVIVLGVLIFFHELGHFMMAKWIGIRVERFSLGFGPRIVGFVHGDTDYCISALPLGGYVKMTGENPEEPLEGKPWEFGSRSVWERARVVLCGPGMNLILAVFFLGFPFFLGRQVPAYLHEEPVIGWIDSDSPAEKAGLMIGDKIISIDEKEVKNWQDVEMLIAIHPETEMVFLVERGGDRLSVRGTPDEVGSIGMGNLGIDRYMPPRIGGLNSGFPAEKAGLRIGDNVISIEGKPLHHWYELADMIHERPELLTKLTIDRDGEVFEVEVTPVAFKAEAKISYASRLIRWIKGLLGAPDTKGITMQGDEDRGGREFGLIGISPYQDMIVRKYGVLGSIKKGFEESLRLLKVTFEFLYKLIAGKASPKSLGGPIMIAHVAGEVARTGLAELIYFMGFLSLQLGILNLLPIPVLDGGHLMFFGIEAIKRRPLSIKSREVAQQIGVALLLILMVYVFYNDILRYFFH